MAVETAEVRANTVDDDDARRPLMTPANIAWMNLGFFGVQFSFGLTQTAVNPIFLLLGAKPEWLPILNIAGPITGLLIQPFIGATSDKTWSPRWGRRKPFVLAGGAVCVLILFLFPLVTALWMAVICLWLVDGGNNTAMEPYRALISDRLRKSQIPRGFLTQSLFTGAGAVLANVSLFVMQKVVTGATDSNVPYWVFVCFWLGAVCCLVTISIAMLRTKEVPPTEAELEEIRTQSKGIPATLKDIATAVKVMPIGMHKIGLAFLFQWYAMFIYWQFVSVSVGESVFHVAPDTPGYEEAAAWTGLMNGTYNFVTMISALFLLPLCVRYGGKKVHAGTLMLAAISLAALSQISSQILTLVPMIGLGICWASMVGVPYLMVASMVPRERTGVYMGILNMMIVVPMLIETLTFGFIFENFLDAKGTSAILLAGGLLGCAGLAMLWVNAPPSDEESTVMPLGGTREITVYDRVVVGSDGSPSALYAVARAQEIAAAAQARMVVVSAFEPGDDTAAHEAVGGRKLMYGERAAREAMHKSVVRLTSDRIRNIEQVVVPGRPAEALLKVAGRNRATLIVVGNRGLGASEGEVLGSVPREIVRTAVCDVTIIQTSPTSGNGESQHQVGGGASPAGGPP
jgi:maltose/moltooligosaccharide transporter